MNPIQNFVKSPLVWILGAGILVGAGATASVLGERAPKQAFQSPLVSVSQPQVVGNLKTDNREMVKALDESFANLAEATRPSVVHIRVSNTQSRNALGELQASGGEGSGVIFRPDGYIVTNDHVVGGFEKVTVILYDGREFVGKVIRAEDSDIAVVKIDAKDLPALPFADSNSVRAGEFAMAIGAPFGLDNTVTVGHISALQRTNQIPDPMTGKYRMYWDLIQTDAPINMGNSGGPLINIDGQVVGINTAIFSPTGTSGGIGFAISSNQARLLAETLIEKGKVTRGFLGVQPENLKGYRMKELGVDGGAYVQDIPNDGPAAIAGIKKGDVVVRIEDIPIKSQVDLRNAMIKYGPGSKVEVEVVRNSERKTFEVTVKEVPAQPKTVVPQPVDPNQLPDIPGFKDFPKTQDPNQMPIVPRTGGARLGASVQDADDTAQKTYDLPAGIKGAVIAAVLPGSVAEKVGLKPGDVVIEFNGKAIQSAGELSAAVRNLKVGDRATLKWKQYKDGASVEKTQEVTFR